MKRLLVIGLAGLFAVIVPSRVGAQTERVLDSELGGRMSVSVDKKLLRGLHISLEEEVRFDENMTALNRLQTTVGFSYKLNSLIKLGFGYALINPYSATDNAFKSARHRMMLDATGGVRWGDWRFSLKERLQATYRTGDMNLYQAPRTALTLKSRMKVSYKGLRRIEPYAFAELRNILNAPVINAAYNTVTDTWVSPTTGLAKNDPGWFLDGFDGCYINRLRGAVGIEYNIDKHNSLDVSLMADYVMDKVVDANPKGTKLKSYTRETGLVAWFTASYSYSF